jgi:hypothetical protein
VRAEDVDKDRREIELGHGATALTISANVATFSIVSKGLPGREA